MTNQNKASSEADARIVVDRLLREAGWDIEDKNQVTTEESIKDGRADYLLLDSRSRPLAVVETKRFSKDPYTAKEQAEIYAKELQAPIPGRSLIGIIIPKSDKSIINLKAKPITILSDLVRG